MPCVRLWIDTDVGTNPDDAVALLCAAGHRGIDLVGVSTVDGDTEWRAEIARTLVDPPVVPGARLRARDVAAAQPEALLAIGPLENVARLAAAGALPPRLGVMGGVLRPVRHRGAERDVEHNFGAEPAAARAVIGQTPGLLLCPLDVTVRM
jgi:inosine-uridine nucleoside N-ribohydrolase